MGTPTLIVAIVMGGIVAAVVLPVALIAWAATRSSGQARRREVEALREHVARLEGEIEQLKDQVADLVIETHDGALLQEEERETVRRLRGQ